MTEIPELRIPKVSPPVPPSPAAVAAATPQTTITPPASVPVKNKSKLGKVLLSVFAGFLMLLLVIAGAGYFLLYLPGQNLLTQAEVIQTDAGKLSAAISNKDLKDAQVQIDNLKSKISQFEASFRKFGYLSSLPYAKDYYADGNRLLTIAQKSLDTGSIVIQAAEPYQDFLGLKGGSQSGAKTTEDRINFLTQSVESLLPHLDSIEKNLADITTSLESINIDRYPENFRGIPLHQYYQTADEMLSQAHNLVKNDRPLLEKVSWLLGKDRPRHYLVIFQNDGELRPSGGFWTAYATIKVQNGKVTPGGASNIYDLDDKLSSTTPSPRLIRSYHINVPYLNLRDSNLSPDFPTDAQIFLDGYYKAFGRNPAFDGVIALDTQVLVDLVKVLGKLDTRVGTFTTDPDKRCDGCPKIIYDLEYIAGRPRNYIEKNRKDFLAPLMQALLANLMGSEKSKMPIIGETAFKSLMHKHVLFYFPDAKMQEAAVKAGIAGKIAAPEGSDYLHLNDANFASAKSNIFITQKIKHEIDVREGQVEHKVSVTYTNPSKASNCNLEKGDLCLNAPKYRNLFRFYVPKGSKLIKMTGSEIEALQYEELGLQTFEGFFGNKYPLYAESSSKTSIQYRSSVPPSKNYSLLLQKQPGTKPVPYELIVNGQKMETFDWVGDKTIKLSL